MSSSATAIGWRRLERVADPLVRRVPYVELTLEHPTLDADGFGDRFFPDAVPYALDDEPRVFYWRPALVDGAPSAPWTAAVATAEGLTGIGDLPAAAPPLVGQSEDGVAAVVDGTVGGESTRALLSAYDTPSVGLSAVTEEAVALTIAGDTATVAVGERRRIALGERPAGVGDTATTVAPELVVRYPGRRTLHHPAPGTDTRLFPDFGLDLDALPSSLDVPTAGGELDHASLAERLAVDLTVRPYPERVLWQAFAFTVFDPHADGSPALGRARTGHLVVDGAAADE